MSGRETIQSRESKVSIRNGLHHATWMSRVSNCMKPIQTKINPGFGVIRERNRDFFLSFFVVPKNKQF